MAESSNISTVIIVVVIFVVIILGFFAFATFKVFSGVFSKIKEIAEPVAQTASIYTHLSALANHEITLLKYIGNILKYSLKYIFGIDLTKEIIPDSKIIILIAVWGIFFVVFRDMVKLFGMMSEATSCLIAFFIATITSNLGFFSLILTTLMEYFAVLAGLSVIAVLFSMVFFAFVAHWGISSLGMWMMKRQAMLTAAKMEAGGEKLAGTITALDEAGEALRKMK